MPALQLETDVKTIMIIIMTKVMMMMMIVYL